MFLQTSLQPNNTPNVSFDVLFWATLKKSMKCNPSFPSCANIWNESKQFPFSCCLFQQWLPLLAVSPAFHSWGGTSAAPRSGWFLGQLLMGVAQNPRVCVWVVRNTPHLSRVWGEITQSVHPVTAKDVTCEDSENSVWMPSMDLA